MPDERSGGGPLQRGINRRELFPSESQKDALTGLVPVLVDQYSTELREDSPYLDQVELADADTAEVREVLAQLQVLATMVGEYALYPNRFDRREHRADLDGGTFRASFRRRGDAPFGEGEANAQTQLRFTFTRGADVPDSEDEITEALSLRRPPDAIADIRSRQGARARDSVVIGTTSVFQERGRIVTRQRAGIELANVEGGVYASGVVFVGTQVHRHDLGFIPEEQAADYASLTQLAMEKSGHLGHPPSSRSAQ